MDKPLEWRLMLDMEDLDIIYEDADIIVCVKPHRVSSQSDRSMDYDMVSRVRNYRAAKGEETYVAIINRLDRPVKGLVLFAKNKKAAAFLSEKMKTHSFGKYYRATVRYGMKPLPEGQVRLTDYLIKDGRSNTSRIVGSDAKGAKKAQLIFHVCDVDEQNRTAQIEIELLTGRHHQIRVQMAHAGFPIVGDTKYGNEQSVDDSGKKKFVDVMLCAYRLDIEHPTTHESMRFDIS